VSLGFGAVYAVFGDSFVHGGRPSSGPPVYYDADALLAEPTADPMVRSGCVQGDKVVCVHTSVVQFAGCESNTAGRPLVLAHCATDQMWVQFNTLCHSDACACCPRSALPQVPLDLR